MSTKNTATETDTNTPAAEGSTDEGVKDTAAAGQGGDNAGESGAVDANQLRDTIEAELRETLSKEIEADVKRKMAKQIEDARDGKSEEAQNAAAERDAAVARIQELETKLNELQTGRETATKRSALEAALTDLVPANVVRLLAREYEGRVKVKGEQVVPLTSEGKEDIVFQKGKPANRSLADFLRSELAASGYEDLMKPSVRGGADAQATETPAGGADNQSSTAALSAAIRAAMS